MTGSASAMTACGRAVVDVERRQGDPVAGPTRSSRSCQDSREPVPGLGPVADDGQAARRAAGAAPSATRRRSAPGPRRRPRGRTGRRAGRGRRRGARVLVDERGAQVLAAQHRHHVHLGVVGRDEVGRRRRPSARARRPRRPRAGAGAGTPRGRRGAAGPRRAAAGRDAVHAVGSSRCSGEHLVAARATGRTAQVGGHRPQVADEVGRLEQRPGAVEGLRSSRLRRSDLAERARAGTSSASSCLVDQDVEQRLPDHVAGLVVRRAGVRGVEGLGPVGGAEPDVAPGRRRPPSPRSVAPRRGARPARSRATSRRPP